MSPWIPGGSRFAKWFKNETSEILLEEGHLNWELYRPRLRQLESTALCWLDNVDCDKGHMYFS